MAAAEPVADGREHSTADAIPTVLPNSAERVSEAEPAMARIDGARADVVRVGAEPAVTEQAGAEAAEEAAPEVFGDGTCTGSKPALEMVIEPSDSLAEPVAAVAMDASTEVDEDRHGHLNQLLDRAALEGVALASPAPVVSAPDPTAEVQQADGEAAELGAPAEVSGEAAHTVEPESDTHHIPPPPVQAEAEAAASPSFAKQSERRPIFVAPVPSPAPAPEAPTASPVEHCPAAGVATVLPASAAAPSIPAPFGGNVLDRIWRYARLAAKAAAAIAIALTLLVLGLVIAYRWVDPPASTLMLAQRLDGVEIQQTWVPLRQISPNLIRAVVVSEDGGFCRHRGVDWGALVDALESSRGGSTITMQLVKNLFLWPSRSYVRKAIEIMLAYLVEALWSKERILEIYLNVAEWGEGIFGAEAAARHHFGVSASRLTSAEAALLAVSLPNPIVREAGTPGPGARRLATNLQFRIRAAPAATACVLARRTPVR